MESLASVKGIIGESAVKHEVNLGVKRLRDLGLEVKFLEHAQKGMGYLADYPESRAQELIQAFKGFFNSYDFVQVSVEMILIGCCLICLRMR